jgi:hypothetical protein
VPASPFTPPRLLQPLLLRGMGALVGGGSRLGTTALLATAVNERLLLANALYERIRKKHGFESRMRLLRLHGERKPHG